MSWRDYLQDAPPGTQIPNPMKNINPNENAFHSNPSFQTPYVVPEVGSSKIQHQSAYGMNHAAVNAPKQVPNLNKNGPVIYCHFFLGGILEAVS